MKPGVPAIVPVCRGLVSSALLDQAKVNQDWLPVSFSEDDVVGLDISMDKALAVEVLNDIEQFVS